MMKHININISGAVQGVGFRFSAYEKFVELGVQGKAENTNDGGVLIDAEGQEDKLEQLIDWSRRGPAGARVENAQIIELKDPFVPLKSS